MSFEMDAGRRAERFRQHVERFAAANQEHCSRLDWGVGAQRVWCADLGDLCGDGS